MDVQVKYYRLKNRIKYRNIHVSWIIALISIGVILGSTLSLFYSEYYGFEWLFIGLCLTFISITNKTGGLKLLLAILAGVSIGLWRGSNLIADQFPLSSYQEQTVVVQGSIVEDPTYNVDGELRFKVDQIVINNEVSSGEIWVSVSKNTDIKRSDTVVLYGELSKGFGNIPAAMYRTKILDVSRQDYSDVARDTRDWFAANIREGIREPEASLGSGFLLGQKTVLPEKLDNELRLLGLTHIVVASGYNLSILVRYSRRLFFKISRFTALAMSGFLVYVFANVTGFSPSMTRASLITGLSLAAWYFGRKFHPVVLLSFSAGLTVLINPAYAWGDIGWLLSFSAFVGVIILSPLIHSYFWGENKPGNFRQIFIETMSAQLLTLPIIMYVFGQYSPLAIVANVLILPLIPIAMLLTFFTGLFSFFLPSYASIFGWPAETLMGYMTVVTERLATHPLAGSEIRLELLPAAVLSLGIAGLIGFLWVKTKYSFREYSLVE